jgi:predicted RNase H-like nuclease (RuvC/YqgF family)
MGFIAQEVETVFPKSVRKKTEKFNDILIEDLRTINADQIYMALVGTVQKLVKENEELKQTVSELKDIVSQLKQKVDLL